MSTGDRTYDVVLWGATGFTGRLVAEHFATTHASDLRWAIAGRDQTALAALRSELTRIDTDLDDLDILVGDAHDRTSLDAIARETVVVCSAAGPYARFGTPLVEACIDHGTHYCDLSGELHWIRQLIDEHDEAAREAGVRIVHSCGFDSVPSDLGTALVQAHATEQFGSPCSAVEAFVSLDSLSLSGGTVAAMVETYDAIDDDPTVARLLEDSHSLSSTDATADHGTPRWPRYDPVVEQWTAPFVMATINEKVVHRTNDLLGTPWTPDFRYREVMATGPGVRGAVTAAVVSAGLALNTALLSVAPVRRLLDRFVLPDSGEGPSRQEIENGAFTVRLRGTGNDASGLDFVVDARVCGDRDPYGASASMLAEAAVCLARHEVDSPHRGGVLTPAAGIGRPLADRLSDVGLTFSIDASEPAAERAQASRPADPAP